MEADEEIFDNDGEDVKNFEIDWSRLQRNFNNNFNHLIS